MSYLSANQKKVIEQRIEPIRHAIDRLIERHYPDLTLEAAEGIVKAMTILCRLRHNTGDRNTARLVNIESPDSHIVDLDMFEERDLIRVCYDPIADRIRTVFPKAEHD